MRNLWLLMLYASDLFTTSAFGKADTEAMLDEIPDLIAELLADAVEQRLRRRMTQGYRARIAVVSRVRGRINLLDTERRQLLQRGLISCAFEELTIDTPRNRFVLAALKSISKIATATLAHRCRKLATAMSEQGVHRIVPTRAESSVDQIARCDSDDRVMVAAARLAMELLLPTEEAGSYLLPTPEREIAWVRRLFERAIGGFYRVMLKSKGWDVRAGARLYWQQSQATGRIADVFPGMKTDVILDHSASGRRIVIDTKFNSIVTAGWYREQVLRSGYVYQIYTYLQSQTGCGDAIADRADGLLLHPAIGESVDESVVIQGHRIRFATIDLADTAQAFRKRLLELCD